MTQPQQYQHYQQPGYGFGVYSHNGQVLTYPGEQQYKVETSKHTGVLVLWVNRQTAVTGTYEQCRAQIMRSLIHCLVLGWWSILSLVFFNWLAIVQNLLALKCLNRDAEMVRRHWAAQPAYQYRPPQG
jgi:hypothetical protein